MGLFTELIRPSNNAPPTSALGSTGAPSWQSEASQLRTIAPPLGSRLYGRTELAERGEPVVCDLHATEPSFGRFPEARHIGKLSRDQLKRAGVLWRTKHV